MPIEILRVGGDLHVFVIGDVAQCYYLCLPLHCLGCMFNRLKILIYKGWIAKPTKRVTLDNLLRLGIKKQMDLFLFCSRFCVTLSSK